jgi:hypothetical protein
MLMYNYTSILKNKSNIHPNICKDRGFVGGKGGGLPPIHNIVIPFQI